MRILRGWGSGAKGQARSAALRRFTRKGRIGVRPSLVASCRFSAKILRALRAFAFRFPQPFAFLSGLCGLAVQLHRNSQRAPIRPGACAARGQARGAALRRFTRKGASECAPPWSRPAVSPRNPLSVPWRPLRLGGSVSSAFAARAGSSAVAIWRRRLATSGLAAARLRQGYAGQARQPYRVFEKPRFYKGMRRR